MGQISKKDVAGIIGEYEDDDEPIRFCPHCLEHGFHNELGPRIYEILKPGQKPKPLPRDADEWLQCNKPNKGCGRIYPKYASKIESTVRDFVSPEGNPHDVGKTIVGLDNKKKKSRIQKERQKQWDRINKVKDEDIKRELKKGNIVELIEDALN